MIQKAKDFIIYSAKALGVPALVAFAVSGFMNTYFQSRLENSKDHVAAIMKGKEDFDSSQLTIFGKLGNFTNDVLSNENSFNTKDLFESIVAAQLQISRLKNAIDTGPNSALDDYAKELERLRSELAAVKSRKDLYPVFESAKKILALHDKVTDEVRLKMQISMF